MSAKLCWPCVVAYVCVVGCGSPSPSVSVSSGGAGHGSGGGESRNGGATAGVSAVAGSGGGGSLGGVGGSRPEAGGTTFGGDAGTGTGGGTVVGGAGMGGMAPSPGSLVNGLQWADTKGNPIQAHGGGVLRVGDEYFWFGENRNPNGSFHAVSVYRSRDLVRWEPAGDALSQSSAPGLDPANIERPKVVYNASTKRYVMWMHWENGAGYGEARAAVASSSSVTGPYEYHGSFRPLAASGVMDHGKPGYMSRDCTLFVDDDGAGYFISASNENYDLNLYRLTPDYLAIDELVAVLFKGGHREAPALFKREGMYFLLTSGATGWSPNQAQYATSRTLGSGWSALANVADSTTYYSQPAYVLPVQGASGTAYLYLGDRWAGAWSGRVNDSTYVWQPITFPSATSLGMSWNNLLTIDAAAGAFSGATKSFRFINLKSDKALEVSGGSVDNGARLVQNPEANSEGQLWSLNYDGAGYFRLTNAKSKKILDVLDESTADGGELVQWESHDGDNQVWLVRDLGQGVVDLANKKSGKLVSVVGGAITDAARVEQRSRGGGDEQRWRLVPQP